MSGRFRFAFIAAALTSMMPAFAADYPALALQQPGLLAPQPGFLVPSGGPTLAQPVATADARNAMQVAPLQIAPAKAITRVTCRTQDLTDFQHYLCRSAGVALPQFGQDIFARQAPFQAADSTPVGPDYVLGAGDQFGVRIWGSIDADLQLVIDRNGSVFIPRVGNISLSGVPYGMLRQQIANAVGRVYRNFDVSVSMGQLRMLPIFVTGYARNPGSYTLNPLSTLVSALFAAGGPSNNGSMRDIQIKRGNRVIAHFDMYDLLLRGDKSQDVLLQPGDVIRIPAARAQVAIYGSVKEAAIYEVNPDEKLQTLIELAGGPRQLALNGQISVERIENQQGRKVETIQPARIGQFALRGGDIVQLYELSSRVDDVVSLRGNVVQPVRMAWRDHMHVSDLIQDRRMLQTDDYWENKTRGTTDERDNHNALALKAKRDLNTDRGEINWDYAAIERVDPTTYSTRLIPFNLAQALIKDPANDLELQAGDIVHVFSKADIQVNSGKRTRYVRIEGEVGTPGIYEAHEGENLRDLIARAGGLTPKAYLYGAEFTRVAVQQQQQTEIDRLARDFQQQSQQQATQEMASAVNTEDIAAARMQADKLQQVATAISQLKANGRVVLGTDPADNTATAPCSTTGLPACQRSSRHTLPGVAEPYRAIARTAAIVAPARRTPVA
ncbi:SLBB domain-containing protein [Silvimonas iriomotensis]|uniref:Protein involved in polysaccharide export, contains SLBB domain of the beta-grasp fold n=1 Tax=Silvimonas iriomotensis TaxID=449662 RepID=A0ABQ2PE39_9NEIS|nr:SLBB domain-containing protein [Silvimonas iriomotensis]GGP23542.1 hypothetical protein GCM10010970_35420 [Silvimonas iriomotensis]